MPRRRVACYLGSISEEHVEDVCSRVDFWKVALARLDGLDLDAETRGRIEVAICTRVPRVSPEDTVRALAERDAFLNPFRGGSFPQRTDP
jgi:hypothetical protein